MARDAVTVQAHRTKLISQLATTDHFLATMMRSKQRRKQHSKQLCWFAFVHALLWLLLFDFAESAGTDGVTGLTCDKAKLISMTLAVLLASAPEDIGCADPPPPSCPPCFVDHISWKRRSANSIVDELGPTCVRRACRMNRSSFWRLCEILKMELQRHEKKRRIEQKKGAKNGKTSGPTRLSCALRFFAGGLPEDISVVHGVSHAAVCDSVWRVADAANKTAALDMSFPADHEEQRRIADGF